MLLEWHCYFFNTCELKLFKNKVVYRRCFTKSGKQFTLLGNSIQASGK